ncbi:glycosyltransferase family 2 protein [Vannielia sp.]|uniref:glycosyltransferase family 2 protein n=1 Tax=Vannielia sp. TaxID=2813045 RepID=UPI002626F769|nr:glycosyltransferase family 2 protein [Vannielia sp.]MDF1871205.1 glycosyltransferase family 2 protein [Vannielia sp.]
MSDGETSKFTILSMMKDEGHCLLEWVAYHRQVGFDNICVYTNNCNDGSDKMLKRLEELGYCHHYDNEVPEGKKPQPNALMLAMKNEQVLNSEWILTMDADEFVSIKCGRGKIWDLVEQLPADTDAINITWRFFGCNDVVDWNPGLVTESYTRAAPDRFRKGWGVKTMFKPFEEMKLGIHRPHMKGAKRLPERAQQMLEQKWVNGSGEYVDNEFNLSGWRSNGKSLGYDLVELNHYGVKSYEAYLLRRMRGNVNNKADKYNAGYFAIFDRNEIKATNATRHARATKRLMEAMLKDDELRRLQEEALIYHYHRVESLRHTGEYDQWLEELREASAIPIDKLNEVLFTKHLPKIWQQKIKEMQEAGVPDREIALLVAGTKNAKMRVKNEREQALAAAAGEGEQVEDRISDEEAIPEETRVLIEQKMREGHAEMAAMRAEKAATASKSSKKGETAATRIGGAPPKRSRSASPAEAGATPAKKRVRVRILSDTPIKGRPPAE